jgi:hypothetical protein
MSVIRSIVPGLVLASSLLVTSAAEPTEELSPPFRILSDDSPIDVEIGHAAPLVADLDGDGKLDLLVGQFKEGRLRIYRNIGSNNDPRFASFAWFQAGGANGKVPSG